MTAYRATLITGFCALTLGALAILFVGARATAAEPTGSITVTVTDAAGQPVPSMRVGLFRSISAKGVNTGGSGGKGGIGNSVIGIPDAMEFGVGAQVASVVSNDKGIAEFKSLKPDTYVVRTGTPAKGGFKYANANVEAGKDSALTIQLSPAKK